MKPALIDLKAKFTKWLIIEEKGNNFLWSYNYPPGEAQPAMRLAGPHACHLPHRRSPGPCPTFCLLCGIQGDVLLEVKVSDLSHKPPPQPDNPDSGLLIAESERGPCNEALEATGSIVLCASSMTTEMASIK